MNQLKKMRLYLGIILLNFYLLPLAIKDMGTAMLLLLLVMPLICFVISLIYGLNHSIDLLYVGLVMVLFIPTLFIFYNSSAFIYTFAYGFVTLIGNIIGRLYARKIK